MKYQIKVLLPLVLALSFAPPLDAQDCSDRKGKWRVANGGTKQNWCTWAKTKNTANRCSTKNLYKDCPLTCDRCPTKAPVPSTLAPIPSTPAPIPSTPAPVAEPNECELVEARLENVEGAIATIGTDVQIVDSKAQAIMSTTTLVVGITVPSEVSFSDEIIVSFTNPDPEVTNWIGIYNASDDPDTSEDDLFWSSMCGSQKDWNKATLCPPLSAGSVTFAATDPDLESDEDWPPSPGAKKVCLMRDDYLSILCESFTINEPLDSWYEDTLTNDKSSYEVGEAIIVNFDLTNETEHIQNSWIGVYKADDANNEMSSIPEPLAWLYSACNNIEGDQSENNDCAATMKSGTVVFDGRFDRDRWYGGWPLPADTYRVCLSLYNNEPYEKFHCAEYTFEIDTPAGVQVPSQVSFGDEFDVSFANLKPESTNWIGIYDDSFFSDTDDDLFWSSMCGSQKDWNNATMCPPLSAGSVTFAATDPDLESDEQWPPNPGAKKACLMRDDHYPLVCESFTINEPLDSWYEDITLTNDKSSYEEGEAIIVNFDLTNEIENIQNVWIGVYKADDANNEMSSIPAPLAWLYTGCDNVAGDQSENNDCAATKKSGTVEFDGRFNSSRWDEDWPLSADTYRVCLSLYNNEPYEKFHCAVNTFDIEPLLAIGVPSEVKFGVEFEVSFSNPNPSASNWIGIYEDIAIGNYTSDDLFWSSMCGSQKDWKNETECPAQHEGSVTFAATDPNLESGEQWPPSPGAKKVCLMPDDLMTPLICESFTIMELYADTTLMSAVASLALSYEVGEAITVLFDAPFAIQNYWIGVYKADDANNEMSSIPEPLAWLYSACNNVAGDQSENNDCAATKKSGTVEFDGRFNSSGWDEDWPLSADTYRVCLSFYNNKPYEEFVCEETTFEVL